MERPKLAIYNNIKEIAKAQGKTIKSIERECHIPLGYMCRWDSYRPTLEMVKRVADHLGVTIDDILNGRGTNNYEESTDTQATHRKL